jgi:hypothetical protein
MYNSKTGKLVNVEPKTDNNDSNNFDDEKLISLECSNIQDPVLSYTKLTHDRSTGMVILNTNPGVLFFKAYQTVFSEGFFKTQGRKNPIRIFCEMKSVGPVLSKAYISVDCFSAPTTNKEDHIPCIKGGMVLNEGFKLDTMITDSVFSLNITDKETTNYKKFIEFNNYQGHIGIAVFLDGTINKLPDHIIVPVADKPLYTIIDNKISLIDTSIPVDIINRMIIGQTLFRIHHSSGYVYPIGSVIVPATWQSYNMILSSVGNYSNDDKVLRMDTKYIKIGLLANYQQGNETGAELLVRNFNICELE